MCTNTALIDSLECYMEDMVECFEDFVKKSLVIVTVAVGAVVAMLVFLLKSLSDRSSYIRGMAGLAAGGQSAIGDRGSFMGGIGSATPGTVCQTAVKPENVNKSIAEKAFSSSKTDDVLSVHSQDTDSRGSHSSKGSRRSLEVKKSNSIDDMSVSVTVSGKCANRKSSSNCCCKKSSSKCCVQKTSSTSANCCTASAVSSCDEVTKDSCSEISNCLKRRIQLRKPCARASTGNCNARLAIPSLPTCNAPKRHLNPARPCMKAVNNRYSCCSVCCENDPR